MRSSAVALAALCLSACETGPVWGYTPDVYLSAASFAESYYGTDVVLLQTSDAIQALDPHTGAQRWHHRASWMMHPPDTSEPLWIVDAPPRTDVTTIVRLEPKSGRELDRVPLDRPIGSVDARVFWANGHVLALSWGRLRSIDPATGTTAWDVAAPAAAYLWAPLVLGDTVVLSGSTYTAYDASTGEVIWTHAGECCAAVDADASIYVRGSADPDRTDRLALDGRVLETRPGRLLAASESYVALQEPTRVAVYAHGARRPVWTGPASTSAVALYGSTLFYYSSADRALWRRDLATHRAARVHEAPSHRIVAPPIWAPPRLFVDDRGIRAYGVSS